MRSVQYSTVHYFTVAHLSNTHDPMSVPTLRECLPFLSTSYGQAYHPAAGLLITSPPTTIIGQLSCLDEILDSVDRFALALVLVFSAFTLQSPTKRTRWPSINAVGVMEEVSTQEASEAEADPCTPSWPCCDQTSFLSY